MLCCAVSLNAQKKLVQVTQSEFTGITVPQGTKQDKRMLSEIAGKALLEMESKKNGVEIEKIELLEVPANNNAQLKTDSIIQSLQSAGWTLSVAAQDNRYSWCDRNGIRLLLYIDSQPKNISCYFGQLKGYQGQQVLTGNQPEANQTQQTYQDPVQQTYPQQVQQNTVTNGGSGNSGISISTTNFDDGWSATPQQDWVQVTRNGINVYLHYAIPLPDDLRSSDENSILTYFWQLLVAPRYVFTTVDKKLSASYEYFKKYYAEGQGTINGQPVFVGFRILIDNGIARCIEIAAPGQQEYQSAFPDLDKIAAMSNYNRFAIAATDITGTWKESKGGFGQYYNVYTGAYAGMNAVSIASEFKIGTDGNCVMTHKGASGMVGSQQFFEEVHKGAYNMNNWEFSFTDQNGKEFPFHAFYQAVKNGRILYLQNKIYSGQEYFFIKAD